MHDHHAFIPDVEQLEYVVYWILYCSEATIEASLFLPVSLAVILALTGVSLRNLQPGTLRKQRYWIPTQTNGQSGARIKPDSVSQA